MLDGPSVPQELYATVPFFSVPFVPIAAPGVQPYALFSDLLKYPWVLRPVAYQNFDDLLVSLDEMVIRPAERKRLERQALLDQLFPLRAIYEQL
jgi:hypothetical protein